MPVAPSKNYVSGGTTGLGISVINEPLHSNNVQREDMTARGGNLLSKFQKITKSSLNIESPNQNVFSSKRHTRNNLEPEYEPQQRLSNRSYNEIDDIRVSRVPMSSDNVIRPSGFDLKNSVLREGQNTNSNHREGQLVHQN